ncbi:uncharacterized protein [Nothobranchius furzeri]|uniref:uncharacterized protein isoform X1 n=1 Tax=Nothobranchius furzeri TaxID=105023 RepID=UPI0039046B58
MVFHSVCVTMGVANRSEFSCLQVGAPGEQLLRIPSSARRGFKERCDNSPVLDDYSHWVLSSSACYQLFNLHSHQLLPGASGSPAHQPHCFSWPPALLRSPARSWNRCSAPSLLHQLPLRPDTPSSPRSTTFLESNAARTVPLRRLPSLIEHNKLYIIFTHLVSFVILHVVGQKTRPHHDSLRWCFLCLKLIFVQIRSFYEAHSGHCLQICS